MHTPYRINFGYETEARTIGNKQWLTRPGEQVSEEVVIRLSTSYTGEPPVVMRVYHNRVSINSKYTITQNGMSTYWGMQPETTSNLVVAYVKPRHHLEINKTR